MFKKLTIFLMNRMYFEFIAKYYEKRGKEVDVKWYKYQEDLKKQADIDIKEFIESNKDLKAELAYSPYTGLCINNNGEVKTIQLTLQQLRDRSKIKD